MPVLGEKSFPRGIKTSAIFETKFKKAGESLGYVVYGRAQLFLFYGSQRGV
jgi:hypothetical protein